MIQSTIILRISDWRRYRITDNQTSKNIVILPKDSLDRYALPKYLEAISPEQYRNSKITKEETAWRISASA